MTNSNTSPSETAAFKRRVDAGPSPDKGDGVTHHTETPVATPVVFGTGADLFSYEVLTDNASDKSSDYPKK